MLVVAQRRQSACLRQLDVCQCANGVRVCCCYCADAWHVLGCQFELSRAAEVAAFRNEVARLEASNAHLESRVASLQRQLETATSTASGGRCTAGEPAGEDTADAPVVPLVSDDEDTTKHQLSSQDRTPTTASHRHRYYIEMQLLKAEKRAMFDAITRLQNENRRLQGGAAASSVSTVSDGC